MKKIIRLIAVAAISGLGLVGVGLMTNTASAAPCSDQSANLTDPVVVAPLGCAYVTVAGVNGCGTQVVLEDGTGTLGYAGASSCGRGHDTTGDGGVAGIVGVSDQTGSGGVGAACSDRWGVNGGGSSTNGGGCYFLDIQNPVDGSHTVIDVDLAEPGETVAALDAVPLVVGGDTSGDYNSTDRDGQGGATCDILDTVSDVVELAGGPEVFPEC